MLLKNLIVLAMGVLMLISACALAAGDDKSFLEQKRAVYVDKVWTGARTMCPIVTRDDVQYLAYYDANRQMTVASRRVDSDKWTYKKLDDKCMWDSHNFISLGIDTEGFVHISGNMHVKSLRYYRSAKPGDVRSIEPIHKMVGGQESKVTYPYFFNGIIGELYFMYRDGSSGQGNSLINRYDTRTQTWSRISDKPLIDGEGKMNAYESWPKSDSHGVYHMAWVWRDTGDILTNQDVSYARTVGSDLASWCKSDKTPLKLPITLGTGEIIDPVPTSSGLRNSVAQITFDLQGRPMVTYVKYRPKERKWTQIYAMRLEDSGWKRYQTTNWTDVDEWSGGGSIGSKVRFGGVAPYKDRMYQVFVNDFQAPYMQIRFLDSKTLHAISDPMRLYPAELDTLPQDRPDTEWSVNWANGELRNWASLDMDTLQKQGSIWVLRWTTMRPNRDQPRATTPPPSRMEVIEFKERSQPITVNRQP